MTGSDRAGWSDEWTELRITDSDIDAPDDADPATSAQSARPPAPVEPNRPGLPLRWCAGLAAVALIAAVGGVVLARHRNRSVTSIQYQDAHSLGIDAGGCPTGDNCSPLDGLYGGLTSAMINDLPDQVEHYADEMLDTSSSAVSRTVRIVQLTEPKITVAALTQCRPDGSAPSARTDGLTGVGPVLAVIIKPLSPGCSIAVLADVPAGVPVPAAALRRLAADPEAAPK